MLTQAQKQQILDKINACYDTCDAHYNRTFKRPTTRFDLTGTTAGTADPRAHVLRFQPVLAAGHWDDFLNNTVPHEVAHLVDYDVNNKLEAQMQARMAAVQNHALFGNWGRRARRPKRDIHGDSWRAVMRVLGINWAARCHQYDVANVARRKARHEYRCTCGDTITLGPKHHNAVQRGHRIVHKSCRGVISAMMLIGRVTPAPMPLAAQLPTPSALGAATKPARMGSKLDQAIQIVGTHAGVAPAQLIQILMRDLSMSKAGATTYYYQAKKRC